MDGSWGKESEDREYYSIIIFGEYQVLNVPKTRFLRGKVETRFFRENLVSWNGKEHRLGNRNLVLKTETWFSRKNQVAKCESGNQVFSGKPGFLAWKGTPP
jgi:hypothetical protein